MQDTPTNAIETDRQLSFRDLVGLALFCAALFGVALVSSRGLTMHEAVLPQSALEMSRSSEWIVPTSGGRPWLERPPLPQWIVKTIAEVASLLDPQWTNREATVRLGSLLAGTTTVLLSACMAARLFGRQHGLVTGFVLATMVQFCRYAWLAEQDIYLTTLVAWTMFTFVRWETSTIADGRWRLLGSRPLQFFVFYVALGMTNLVKGVLFGPAMVLLPLGVYLMVPSRWARLREFVWVPGILISAMIAAAWPLAAWLRHPDVIDLWLYDHMGRLTGAYTDINEPFWYYGLSLPWVLLPWTAPALVALSMTWQTIRTPERNGWAFVWCWALVPIIIFSFARGKHHHYMLHYMPAWAMLATAGLPAFHRACQRVLASDRQAAIAGAVLLAGGGLGVAYFFDKIPGPTLAKSVMLACLATTLGLLLTGIRSQQSARSLTLCLTGILILYVGGYSFTAKAIDECRYDTAFLREVATKTGTETIWVNADLESMDIFRILFYLGQRGRSLHNLTFLVSADVPREAIWVVSKAKDESLLAEYGSVKVVGRSEKSRRENGPGDRLTLFRVDLDTDLPRIAGWPTVTPMQAMDRAEGPFLR